MRSELPWTRPPRTPPPASSTDWQNPQWSRPAFLPIRGVRPKSPSHTISVSSSRPRSPRSESKRGSGGMVTRCDASEVERDVALSNREEEGDGDAPAGVLVQPPREAEGRRDVPRLPAEAGHGACDAREVARGGLAQGAWVEM